MFNQLSERFQKIVHSVRDRGRLTEDNIRESLRDVRLALLEADVALPVVKSFVEQVRERAIGQDINQNLSPGQTFIKIVQQELIHILGDQTASLRFDTPKPMVILVAGLQGAGKTTSVGKLARWLKETQKKSVLVVSTDVNRPAAMDQLAVLAQQIDVSCVPSNPQQTPLAIAQQALTQAKQTWADVLIVDTAGRLHVDEAMMEEVQALHSELQPVETLFVVDCMAGQDAVNTAQAFNERLPLTGVILTKADGDARGGVALTVRSVTGKPIKFIGLGEKIDALDVFHPDRLASRILGMGDVLSLVESTEQKVDIQKAKKLSKKLAKGQGFDFEDFRDQLQQMRNMGGIASLLDKLPMMGRMGQAAKMAKSQLNDKQFIHMEAIINSMTPQERRFPAVINSSRKKRIASGSGLDVPAINRLLKQFLGMQKMMKKVGKKGAFARLMH